MDIILNIQATFQTVHNSAENTFYFLYKNEKNYICSKYMYGKNKLTKLELGTSTDIVYNNPQYSKYPTYKLTSSRF